MNRKSVIGIVLLSVLIGSVVFGSIEINAERLAFDAYLGFEVNIASPTWNTLTFYSNYSNLFYVFFQYNRPLVGWTTYYVSSSDGINWSNHTRLFFPDSGGAYPMSAGRWDLYIEPNGRYLHGALLKTTTSPNSIYYFKRELFKNGSLGLCGYDTQTPQLIFNEGLGGHGEANKYIDIYLDNESYPYITFTSHKSDGGWETGYLIEGDYPINGSGYWGKDDYNLVEWQVEFGNLWDTQWKCTVTGLSDGVSETGFGRGVHWMQTHESSLNSDKEISASAHNYYNGSGWINHDDGDGGMFDNEGDWADETWDIVAIGNITLYVKQTEQTTMPEDRIQLSYGTRIAGQEWNDTRRRVSDDVLGDAGAIIFSPKIAVDYNRNVVIVWTIHHPDNNTVWYRMGNIGFDGIMTWITNQTEWENWQQGGNWFWDSYSSGGAEPLGVGVPLSLMYVDGANEWVFHDYIFPLEGDELPLPALAHFNSTLYNDDGSINDGWMFEGDIYTFETFAIGADEFYLNFTDGQHEILLRFDESDESLYIEAGERFVIGEIFTNYTLYPNGIQELVWRFIPDINIVDVVNTTVYYYIHNSTLNWTWTGTTFITFNIYNLGGLTYYTFVGDGGRTPYGSAFDLYATNGSTGSSATAEQIFRKLQHVSFLIEIDMGNEWDAGNGEFDIDAGVGYVDVGIDYRLNGTWVEGYKIRIYVFDADVGHHLGGNDQDWVLWSVDFHNYDPLAGNQQNLQTKYIYSNHWGYERRNFVPDYYINRTSSQLWIDLWFDKTNASTTIATQTNAYYRGMKEQGSAWWFGYGVFTPMIGDYDNAKFLDYLYDEGGNVTNVQKFDLMKFYITVGKINIVDGNDETWRITAIEDMHRELAIDRMEGIDEPTFVETKIIDMPQTGFINALKSAINGLSKLIWAGAFQFVKLLMGAVGSLMDAIGLGEWWIAFNTMLGQLATFSLNLMEQLKIALINSALLLTQIFALISAGLGRFIGFFTSSVSAILEWYQGIIDLFTGSGGIFNVDIWRNLGLGDWAILGIHLLPVWWIDRLAKAESLSETAQSDIMFIVWIVSGLLNFLITIIALSIELFNFFIGLLPI